MVDPPGSARQASSDHRDALERVGFEMDGVHDGAATVALRARRDAEEARLDFFDRETGTRLEILFIGRPDSRNEPGS